MSKITLIENTVKCESLLQSLTKRKEQIQKEYTRYNNDGPSQEVQDEWFKQTMKEEMINERLEMLNIFLKEYMTKLKEIDS